MDSNGEIGWLVIAIMIISYVGWEYLKKRSGGKP